MSDQGSISHHCALATESPIPIVPVIDLLDGNVVRAIGGVRDEYQPWRSGLCPTADPVELAENARALVGHQRLYVADIDALEGRSADGDAVARLAQRSSVLYDAGLRSNDDAQRLLAALGRSASNVTAILASETSVDLSLAESLAKE